MGFLSNFGSNTKQRVAREAENWRSPRTMDGQNISLVEAGYYGLVLFTAVLLAGLAQRSPLGQVVVFGGAVVALSAHVRRSTLPALYNLIAPKFGWRPFSEAIKQELAADASKTADQAKTPEVPAAAAEASVPVAPVEALVPTHAGASPPLPVEPEPASAQEVLRVFAGLPASDRRARSLQVVQFLQTSGRDFSTVVTVPDEEERRIVAEFALLDLARKEGVA